jgi:hypothetical protein
LLAFYLFTNPIFCEDLPKCDPVLEYLYNHFYDPDALEIGHESPAPPFDTLSIPDSMALIDSLASDSSIIEQMQSKKTAARTYMEDSLDEISRDPIHLTGFDPLNNPSLLIIDDVPYIRVFMQYTGDESDLHALEVETSAHFKNTLIARFPLSLLPQVHALPTVKAIGSDSKIELNTKNN